MSNQEDYLDEDKPMTLRVMKQRFCVISMLTPNSFPEERRAEFANQKILGLKVKGVFETYEDAKSWCDRFQKMQKEHHLFVGEVGKWLPFDVDISNMETEDDPVYREKALNDYMGSYKKCLTEEDEKEKARRAEQLQGANVVTNTLNAPNYTGIGNPNITDPGITPAAYDWSEGLGELEKDMNENLTGQTTTPEPKVSLENKKIETEEELNKRKESLINIENKLNEIKKIQSQLKK